MKRSQSNRVGRLKLAACLTGALLLGAVAVFPVQPAGAQENQSTAARSRNNTAAKPATAPPTAEEEAKTAQFMEQYAPERFKVFKASRDGAAKKQFGQFLINRWRRLEELRTRQPDLYQVRVEAIRLDDDIFSICRQMKKANTADKQKLLADLKGKVADLFDNGLHERKIRIAQLEAQLKNQTDLLEADSSKREELIARRYRQISTQGVAGARLGNSSSKETIAAPERPPGDKDDDNIDSDH